MLGVDTECHIGCYVCFAFIQDVTLVVMCVWFSIQGITLVVLCVWFLYRVPPSLLCVFGLSTGCDLRYYVLMVFIQGVTLVVLCVWPLYRV